jgi:hypothetical protein
MCKTFLLLICAAAFFTFSAAVAGKADYDEVTLIVGTVETGGMLMDEKGIPYKVVGDENGEDLLKNQGQKVLVTGKVEENSGVKSIRIHSYQLWCLPGQSEKESESD